MNVLLDTHAWRWFSLGDARLSQTAQNTIVSPANVIYVSPASYWEFSIKISLGRYSLQTPYSTFMQSAISGNGFSILPIETLHTERVSTLSMPSNNHRDPFDRLLVSQALVEGMHVVSNDADLDVYGIQRIW